MNLFLRISICLTVFLCVSLFQGCGSTTLAVFGKQIDEYNLKRGDEGKLPDKSLILVPFIAGDYLFVRYALWDDDGSSRENASRMVSFWLADYIAMAFITKIAPPKRNSMPTNPQGGSK